MINTLHITSFYASALAVWIVVLGFRVAMTRKREKIGVGDGKNLTLSRFKAAHENALDNIPIFLILLGLFEYNGGGTMALHTFGGGFALARVLHAFGISRHAGHSFGRLAGIVLSWLCIVSLAVFVFMQALN